METWRCGEEAASRLRGLIGSGRVDCRGRGMDAYGRTLATCAVSGVELNRTMVETGWATAFRKYSQDYVREEDQAKAARRGIWSSQFQQPEEYRAAQAITRSGAPARHAPAYLAAPSRN
ncbi:thermonuclease family protein, partial [Novosphingobium tardum]